MPADQIKYSEKYYDKIYEYRYVCLLRCVRLFFYKSLMLFLLAAQQNINLPDFVYISFYRHVILPIEMAKNVPKTHLMTETEWRNLGVQQSPGWVHYMLHAPEPQVILFRRALTDETRLTDLNI